MFERGEQQQEQGGADADAGAARKKAEEAAAVWSTADHTHASRTFLLSIPVFPGHTSLPPRFSECEGPAADSSSAILQWGVAVQTGSA